MTAVIAAAMAAFPAARQAAPPSSLQGGVPFGPTFASPRPPGCTKPRLASPAAKPTPIDQMFAAYATRGQVVFAETITSEKAFDDLRQELPATVERWKAKPRPAEAVFLLEFAQHAFDRRWYYWLDVLDVGRRFVMSRELRPGDRSPEDEFELLWHKTALALLGAARRPEVLEDCGIRPLAKRLVAARPDDGSPAIVDPWIALQAGLCEELWTVFDPPQLPSRAPAALARLNIAARYPSTRAEALVRQARILTRLERYQEAIAALDGIGDARSDVFVHYWAALFRGAAQHGLGDAPAAIKAYEDALAISPGAQSPQVGLMAIAFTHDQIEDARARAAALKASAVPTADPWWEYGYGDQRFLTQRLERLRALSGAVNR